MLSAFVVRLLLLLLLLIKLFDVPKIEEEDLMVSAGVEVIVDSGAFACNVLLNRDEV